MLAIDTQFAVTIALGVAGRVGVVWVGSCSSVTRVEVVAHMISM
jgi:hypothetical protein